MKSKKQLLPGLLLAAAFASLPCPVPGQTTPAGTPSAFEVPATDDGLPGVGPIRRYTWFLELWRERRSTWAHQVEADQQAVVFLGDSITQLWGDDLGRAFPGMKTANRGISGDTTRGVLIRLREDVLSLHPRGVVLLIGTNDLEEGADPDTIVANLRLVLAALEQSDPALPIILCQVFPSSPEKRRPAAKIRRINELFQAAVKNNPRVTLLETWPLFADTAGNAPVAEFPDLLHPNEIGYAQWAAALRPVLATLGLFDEPADVFAPEPGFQPLFNGYDLTGWGVRPTPPDQIESARQWQAADPEHAATWPIVTEAQGFAGRSESADGRFLARDGRLVVTTPPEYRKIQALWTTDDFPGDFELRLEFRATPNADSGVFLRGVQLQCRDYRLAGPYNGLQHYRPQDWNELVVVVRDNVARATCNGEIVEQALPLPATGPIGLEGDRGQMEYRRLRLKR